MLISDTARACGSVFHVLCFHEVKRIRFPWPLLLCSLITSAEVRLCIPVRSWHQRIMVQDRCLCFSSRRPHGLLCLNGANPLLLPGQWPYSSAALCFSSFGGILCILSASYTLTNSIMSSLIKGNLRPPNVVVCC